MLPTIEILLETFESKAKDFQISDFLNKNFHGENSMGILEPHRAQESSQFQKLSILKYHIFLDLRFYPFYPGIAHFLDLGIFEKTCTFIPGNGDFQIWESLSRDDFL